MINKTVVIVGSVALLGVGAYIYFRPKATDKGTGEINSGGVDSTDNSGASSLNNTVVQTRDNVTNEPLKTPIVKTLTNTDILAVQRLRDEIIANINRRNRYRTQGSKNAVQVDINNQMNRLKEYGYSLDTNNNLIKIVPDFL